MDTPGGRYYAEFDDESPVTREGQLIFFAQFLRVGGRWERFVSNCPLSLKTGMAEVETVQATQHQTNPIAPRWTFRVRTH